MDHLTYVLRDSTGPLQIFGTFRTNEDTIVNGM